MGLVLVSSENMLEFLSENAVRKQTPLSTDSEIFSFLVGCASLRSPLPLPPFIFLPLELDPPDDSREGEGRKAALKRSCVL